MPGADEFVRAEYEASRDRNYAEEMRNLVPVTLAGREQVPGGGRIAVEELTKLMT